MDMQNKAKKLIEMIQTAPVEWKPLGEVGLIYGGLTGKNKYDFENGNSKYVTYKNIFDNIEVDLNNLGTVRVNTGEKQHCIKYGDILFTGSSETADEAGMSSVVTSKFDEMIFLNSFSFGFRFNENIIIPEFAKYLFRSYFIRKEIIKTASGVTRFNISKERFKKIRIPIPPLETQKKIVKILDKFTELEATLEAELALRKRQYRYYRDFLLDFDNQIGGGIADGYQCRLKDVVWKTLGEVGTLIRGNGLQKKDFTEDGIPAIHYGQIYTQYGNQITETISFVSPELAEKLRKVDKGDVVITNTSENIEDVGKALLYLGERQAVTGGHATIFKPGKEIIGKFFVHFTQTEIFNKAKRKFAKGTKVIDVSATDMAKIKIPIPPLPEQEKIVAILDKFDTLTHSISEGLPHEIVLRRKQYEYYREQLLAFPKAT